MCNRSAGIQALINPYSAGIDFRRQRRQILTYKDGSCTVKIIIFKMAVHSYHRYSNEAERAK